MQGCLDINNKIRWKESYIKSTVISAHILSTSVRLAEHHGDSARKDETKQCDKYFSLPEYSGKTHYRLHW